MGEYNKTMKTIKQIADALGIDKQKVYRYIKKNHIIEAHRSTSKLYYSASLEAEIKAHCMGDYAKETASSEVLQSASTASNDTVIQALINQLETKDKQIADLTETIKNLSQSINAGQHNQLAETILDGQSSLSAPAADTASASGSASEKVGFWGKIFKHRK